MSNDVDYLECPHVPKWLDSVKHAAKVQVPKSPTLDGYLNHSYCGHLQNALILGICSLFVHCSCNIPVRFDEKTKMLKYLVGHARTHSAGSNTENATCVPCSRAPYHANGCARGHSHSNALNGAFPLFFSSSTPLPCFPFVMCIALDTILLKNSVFMFFLCIRRDFLVPLRARAPGARAPGACIL